MDRTFTDIEDLLPINMKRLMSKKAWKKIRI